MKIPIILFFFILSLNVNAAESYQSGSISNLTATTAGIMIMLDKGLPTKCNGSPYGWMLIKQEYTALTSVVLAGWVSGKKSGTVYISGRENGDGVCIINQWDPEN